MRLEQLIDSLKKRRAELIEGAIKVAQTHPDGKEASQVLLLKVAGLDEAEKIMLDYARGERERDEDAGS